MYSAIVGLHAIAMLAAIVLFMASEVLLIPAIRGTRTTIKPAFRASQVGNGLAAVGVFAGLVLLVVGGWSLATPWLAASIVLIASMILVERKVVRPWEARVWSALRDAASSDRIRLIARDRSALCGRMTVIVLFALIATLMVVKPARVAI